MILDADVCYRAVAGRDRRFEGRFVVAVKTTGIYCRPGCPAPIPRRVNVVFYPSSAAAEQAGFRPCRRCRPDASPETPAWRGTEATVTRAMRLIGEGALDGEEGSVDLLGRRVGVGERHLRRLFAAHLAASPIAVAQTRRLHFARRLLDQTDLKITEVALAAGYASTRRFHDAFRKTFRLSPTEARERRPGTPGGGLTLTLPFKPPYEWDSLLGFLAARAIPGVESVEGGVYRRTTGEGWIAVRPGPRALRLEVNAVGPASLAQVAESARRLFDLSADPIRIGAHLRRDPRLAPLVKARPGLRVPGAWDTFEVAARAVLGQQVSVAAATTLAGRLVEAFGDRVKGGPGGLAFTFPGPKRLARANLRRIGLTASRARTLQELSAAFAAGEPPESLPAIRGLGPWTEGYIAMRGLGLPDAFPSGDLGLKRALGTGSEQEIEARAEAWRPWRAYAAMHLWRSLG